MDIVSKRLKELRTSHSMTLKEVSSQLNINLATYAHYEQGIRQPPIELIRKICDLFDITADYLIGRTDSY